MIKVNDSAKMIRTVTNEDIVLFSEVSGDKNPLHLDEEYAKTTLFKQRIAHGMLSASFISNVIGNTLPGQGSIYLKQTLEFCRPVYLNDTITTVITIEDINYETGNISLDTYCMNQNGVKVIKGKALVKNKKVLID